MSEPGDSYVAAREQAQREICKAFGVKPWQVGVGPVPWWYPRWLKAGFSSVWRWLEGRRLPEV